MPLHALRISRRIEIVLIKRYLQLKRGDLVCDIGSGDGYWTKRLAAEAKIVGIDIDTPSLQGAQQNGKTANTQYLQASATDMPFADATFDKLFGVCSVEHILENEKAFSEFARCTKPGGVVVLTLDSLSDPRTTDEQRKEHHERYYTPHLYDLPYAKECLEKAGLKLTDHTFIISSPISSRLYSVFDRVRRLQYVLFPVAYPLIRISDAIWGSRTHGWKLAVRAVKPA